MLPFEKQFGDSIQPGDLGWESRHAQFPQSGSSEQEAAHREIHEKRVEQMRSL